MNFTAWKYYRLIALGLILNLPVSAEEEKTVIFKNDAGYIQKIGKLRKRLEMVRLRHAMRRFLNLQNKGIFVQHLRLIILINFILIKRKECIRRSSYQT